MSYQRMQLHTQLAAYLSINKPISTIRQTVEQTEVIQEMNLPEIIKLNQSVYNEQKTRTPNNSLPQIHHLSIAPVDGLCYKIID